LSIKISNFAFIPGEIRTLRFYDCDCEDDGGGLSPVGVAISQYEAIAFDGDLGCDEASFEAVYVAKDCNALVAEMEALGDTLVDVETPTKPFSPYDPCERPYLVPVEGGWIKITGDLVDEMQDEDCEPGDFAHLPKIDGDHDKEIFSADDCVFVPVDGGWIRITGHSAKLMFELV